MSVIWTLSFAITLIILTIVVVTGANQLHIGDPDPEYNCSYCQPEQIHISFGGKLYSSITHARCVIFLSHINNVILCHEASRHLLFLTGFLTS